MILPCASNSILFQASWYDSPHSANCWGSTEASLPELMTISTAFSGIVETCTIRTHWDSWETSGDIVACIFGNEQEAVKSITSKSTGGMSKFPSSTPTSTCSTMHSSGVQHDADVFTIFLDFSHSTWPFSNHPKNQGLWWDDSIGIWPQPGGISTLRCREILERNGGFGTIIEVNGEMLGFSNIIWDPWSLGVNVLCRFSWRSWCTNKALIFFRANMDHFMGIADWCNQWCLGPKSGGIKTPKIGGISGKMIVDQPSNLGHPMIPGCSGVRCVAYSRPPLTIVDEVHAPLTSKLTHRHWKHGYVVRIQQCVVETRNPWIPSFYILYIYT